MNITTPNSERKDIRYIVEQNVDHYYHKYPIGGLPTLLIFFNSSFLLDVFIINSVEQLQT